MFKTIGNAFKIPELRKKMLYTLFIIMIFRIGSRIPVPFLDPAKLGSNAVSEQSTLLGLFNIFSGGAFDYGAIFAMGITPYINSSIIMQLLAVAIPALERLQQEGEEGRKKIGQITRYLTVGLGLLQGTAYYIYLSNQGYALSYTGFFKVFAAIVIIAAFTAGSALVMWLGEQINQNGIGNGISIILFAGIISRLPVSVLRLYDYAKQDLQKHLPIVIGVVIVFLMVIVFIVYMTNAERRIKIQYAKRVVGRKMYGGQSTHMPIRVNIAGVLPIIFASTILAIPGTIIAFARLKKGILYSILHVFESGQPVYTILYLLFIVGFSYFYIGIQYNPIEMANNLRNNRGAIPGIRPRQPTSDYITGILSRVTFIGAIFLAIIAFLPILAGYIATGLQNLALGGTSILILVGVALETFEAIESQMLMRHYKGFLD
jgi:preprotein translocase subunit SecY